MILDITTWLRDGRLADLEVQKAAQEFIFTRGDLYTSDMLILQYSVDKGQPKSELTYENVKEAILAVLMVESPDVFKKYDATSDRYIHRFTRMVADTGLSYEMKAKVMYVQCDKCLAQLRDGTNAESADGTPDRLQVWLASFADPNAPEVMEWATNDPELKDMMGEATAMAQNKEVQAMLTQERYDRMDWLSYGAEREARGEVNAYLKLVRSGAISVETAASSLGVTTDDFRRAYMGPTGT